MAELVFAPTLARALNGAEAVLLLVPEPLAKGGWLARALDVPWRGLLEKALARKEAGPAGRTFSFVNPEGGPGTGAPERIVVALLPARVSRHNAPARTEAVGSAAVGADLFAQPSAVIAALDDSSHALAVARAVARGLPAFSRSTNGGRSGKKPPKRRVAFVALDAQGAPVPLAAPERAVVERVRWVAHLVDTPTAEMTTADFEKAVRKAARGMARVRVSALRGDELLEHGLGGIHAVGRTAEVAPRLLVLEYRPAKPRRTVALVGKGVVYDTGGLSLKPSASMTGMKKDMGGAAAVMGAALALAEGKAKDRILAVAPLAENAIGPGAYRPDDILTLHSGKTVEINNTDAEGRLLLADAVSWVCRRHEPDVVIDAATLTGAQPISTGYRHAAVVSNREGLERLAVAAGRSTGDLAHPLPFAPELFQEEFRSKVADMKNSVANRANAQSSCAAQFVYSHVQDLDRPWLHVDMAGPVSRDERATGYGVALLAAIVPAIRAEDLTG